MPARRLRPRIRLFRDLRDWLCPPRTPRALPLSTSCSCFAASALLKNGRNYGGSCLPIVHVRQCQILPPQPPPLIFFTKVFTLMPERVLITRPLRHPPIIVATDGQLDSEREPSIGVLLADALSKTRIAMFSVIAASLFTFLAQVETGSQNHRPQTSKDEPPRCYLVRSQ